MNEYEKIALETRKKVSKITLEQLKDLLDLYNDVIKDLAKTAKNSGDKTLTNRWVTDYRNQLMQSRKELRAEIKNQITSSIKESSKIGIEGQQIVMKQIFEMSGIDTGEHFTSMFSKVNDNVIKDIISGNLYKDKKTLSNRIWSYGDEFEKDIQYTINKAMLEKKSAIELAADLEKYVLDPAKRGSDWGSCYPNLRNKKVDYNAMRLARTSINHSYQTASIQGSNLNPFVEGIELNSAQIHGRTCDLCLERHGQIFPKDNVPLDHANGLCTMIPHIPNSLDEVAAELRNWLDGKGNNKLDSWYNENGLYFATKKI